MGDILLNGPKCTLIKEDDIFNKCVEGKDLNACLDRLPGMLLEMNDSKDASLKKCTDGDGYYFEMDGLSIAMCGKTHPTFATNRIFSQGEVEKCEEYSYLKLPDDLYYGFGNVTPTTRYIPPDRDIGVGTTLDSGYDGFLNPHTIWDSKHGWFPNPHEKSILGYEPPIEEITVPEREVETARTGHVSIALNNISKDDLGRLNELLDRIILSGVDAMDVAKIERGALQQMATCGANEICGTRQRSANALLDAINVREFLNGTQR